MVLSCASALLRAAAPQVGSPDTAVAEPPVPRPDTAPCRVTLFDGVLFADFSGKSFSYAPPADCPGPWAKVVLEGDFAVSAGRQYDRTANLWLGGATLRSYFSVDADGACCSRSLTAAQSSASSSHPNADVLTSVVDGAGCDEQGGATGEGGFAAIDSILGRAAGTRLRAAPVTGRA